MNAMRTGGLAWSLMPGDAATAETKKPAQMKLDAPPRAMPAPSSMGQVQLTFAPVVKRVVPAVVNVYARAIVQAQANRYSDTAGLFQSLGGGWWNRKEDPRYEQFGSSGK